MMQDISLHVLDIAENSTRAGASLVTISIVINTGSDHLTIRIDDDGCGMDAEQLARTTDPFYTSRITRKVGLGIPFFKFATEITGGTFSIQSLPDKGTSVAAEFVLSHIDRPPLGDMNTTIYTLVVYHPDTDFIYHYQYNDHEFKLDTRDLRMILGDLSFSSPEISAYIMDYLTENQFETDHGAVY